jgi:hypothetical protein
VDAYIPPSKVVGDVVNLSGNLYRVRGWVDQPHHLASLKRMGWVSSTIYRSWCWLTSELHRYRRIIQRGFAMNGGTSEQTSTDDRKLPDLRQESNLDLQ